MDEDARGPLGISFGRLPGYIGYQMRQAQAAVFRDFAAITEAHGLTPGEFGLLAMVEANPGISQIALANVYRLNKSTLSLSVKSLTRRGLLRRTRGTDDRRFFGLWLTPSGQETLARVTEGVERQERRMEATLRPGERERLLDMLGRVARAFD